MMRTRFLRIRHTALGILMIMFVNSTIAQGRGLSEKILPTLFIKDTMVVVTLDSLIKHEKKCRDFDNSLIWTLTAVTDTNKNKYAVEITMVSTIDNCDPYGYFYLDKTLCIAVGKRLEDLFTISKTKKKFYFKQKKSFYPEDYSVWYYNFSTPNFILEKAYPLKCDAD